jgi:putative endonuclease
VDIIARDEHALHFVEVKTRRGPKRGFPSEAVTDCKRARYERIAGAFLMDYEEVDIYVTFDVIGIMVTAPDRAFLRMTANAFSF